MYKIIIKHQDKEEILEFETAKLGKLYKDYHLAFGNWKNKSRWIFEDKITQEEKRFIIDEKTDLIDGLIKRSYLITDGIEIKGFEVYGSQLQECWDIYKDTCWKLERDCDWTQIADSPLTHEEKLKWRKYRDYLRTAPKLHNDSTILEATPATFEEWINGKV